MRLAPIARGRILRYALVLAAGVVIGAAALAAGSRLRHTSTSAGTPIVSVRPTGVGLPLVGATGTVGASDYAAALKSYHDSGAYERDLRKVDRGARRYLLGRVRALRRGASGCGAARRDGLARSRRRAACQRRAPALVLDIDETSLSNYGYLADASFSGVVGALAQGVVHATDPPIGPTLRLYRHARRHGVAVFFVTGRPDVASIRALTEQNLHGAGYDGWAGLSLNSSGMGTVAYKSGERASIERRGYRIIANVGDQESDLQGGHADRAFKLPNPFYFIGP